MMVNKSVEKSQIPILVLGIFSNLICFCKLKYMFCIFLFNYFILLLWSEKLLICYSLQVCVHLCSYKPFSVPCVYTKLEIIYIYQLKNKRFCHLTLDSYIQNFYFTLSLHPNEQYCKILWVCHALFKIYCNVISDYTVGFFV
jgi:hypothetical protein